jgi:hypothetical protein
VLKAVSVARHMDCSTFPAIGQGKVTQRLSVYDNY